MKQITFTNPHRQRHFEFFKSMNSPHFNITANVDITALMNFLKNKELPFTPSIVFFVSKIANEIKEFRWRIRGNEIVEHEVVHPSFTVYTEEADVFSFCEVKFEANFLNFVNKAKIQIDKMKKSPVFEDEAGRDDYLFLSAIPWVSFTGFQHAMHLRNSDSIPRITWGKYFKENNSIKMPLSVQAHHALVDGRHTGRYFQMFEEYMRTGF